MDVLNASGISMICVWISNTQKQSLDTTYISWFIDIHDSIFVLPIFVVSHIQSMDLQHQTCYIKISRCIQDLHQVNNGYQNSSYIYSSSIRAISVIQQFDLSIYGIMFKFHARAETIKNVQCIRTYRCLSVH